MSISFEHEIGRIRQQQTEAAWLGQKMNKTSEKSKLLKRWRAHTAQTSLYPTGCCGSRRTQRTQPVLSPATPFQPSREGMVVALRGQMIHLILQDYSWSSMNCTCPNHHRCEVQCSIPTELSLHTASLRVRTDHHKSILSGRAPPAGPTVPLTEGHGLME